MTLVCRGYRFILLLSLTMKLIFWATKLEAKIMTEALRNVLPEELAVSFQTMAVVSIPCPWKVMLGLALGIITFSLVYERINVVIYDVILR